jgi:hypothetical protein
MLARDVHPKLSRICDFFPRFVKWLDSAKQNAFGKDCNAYRDAAESVLKNIPDAILDEACRLILERGNCGPLERLPYHVAKVARDLRRESLLRERNTPSNCDCFECEGTGLLTVVHPTTLKDALSTGQLPRHIYTAAVACTCPAGQFYGSAGSLRVVDYQRDVIVQLGESPRETLSRRMVPHVPSDDSGPDSTMPNHDEPPPF